MLVKEIPKLFGLVFIHPNSSRALLKPIQLRQQAGFLFGCERGEFHFAFSSLRLFDLIKCSLFMCSRNIVLAWTSLPFVTLHAHIGQTNVSRALILSFIQSQFLSPLQVLWCVPAMWRGNAATNLNLDYPLTR